MAAALGTLAGNGLRIEDLMRFDLFDWFRDYGICAWLQLVWYATMLLIATLLVADAKGKKNWQERILVLPEVIALSLLALTLVIIISFFIAIFAFFLLEKFAKGLDPKINIANRLVTAILAFGVSALFFLLWWHYSRRKL